MDIYHTENSVYEIDLPNRLYRRSAKLEQTVVSPRLKYGEWLPLADIPEPVTLLRDDSDPFKAPELRMTRLHIMHATSKAGIYTSPIVFMAKDVAHS